MAKAKPADDFEVDVSAITRGGSYVVDPKTKTVTRVACTEPAPADLAPTPQPVATAPADAAAPAPAQE